MRSTLWSLFSWLKRRRLNLDDELDEEVRSHIQLRADDLERSGVRRAEAERRARVEFGARERVKDECRDALGRRILETLIQDVRFSLRVLRKSPAFTIAAVITLALAIGANAVVFGVMNGFILRPLSVPQPESVYGIEHGHEHDMTISYPDYLDLRDRNRSFDGLAAFNLATVGLDTDGNPSSSWIMEVSGNFFDALRLQPYLGRVFHGADEHGPDSAPYVVLSYPFWHNHFQDDPNVVGRVVRLNKHPFTIIGVAAPEFHGIIAFLVPDLFVPMVNQPQIDGRSVLDRRGTRWVFMTLGHLKPGVAPEQAVADLNALGAYLEKTYPKDHGSTTFVLARPGLYGNYLGAPMRAFLSGLMLLSGLILVAACANLGGLFAARAADRSREVALRLALGASRYRIIRQLLTEAVLIALAGGAVGLVGSISLLRGLAVWHPFPKFPIGLPVSPDANVYIVAFAFALASGLLFGLVPVRQVLRANPYSLVKAGPAGPPSKGGRLAIRDVLLVGQIAICGVLVTASMVAVRGLTRSLNSHYGFEPRHVLLADTDLSMAGYAGDQASAMQRRMIDAVAAIPDVTSVGLVGRLPLGPDAAVSQIFTDQTADLRPSNAAFTAIRYQISPEYFHAAGTALLSGRAFSWQDDTDAPRVAVVNREFAARVFGSTPGALGGQFKLHDGSRIQVVGVVEDGKYGTLAEDPRPAMFVPILQMPMTQMWLVVRSTGDADQLGPAIRTTLHALDAGLPVFIQTWDRELDLALFAPRMATASLGVMGAMGAVLALTGIFGMAAYSVSRRMKELGIRVALGAQRRHVLQAALGRALKLLACGSLAGLLLGILASSLLGSIVYGATPRDPFVLAGVVLIMVLLGLVATWIPARRALSTDPLTLLREG
jgi:predicted permease